MTAVAFGSTVFQSTPSQEGEPATILKILNYKGISIHSLARGRTAEFISKYFSKGISIHSLARGRTAVRISDGEKVEDFNPLPRKRENLTRYAQTLHTRANFNPLPRKRENCPLARNKFVESDFNPLPRKRENEVRLYKGN